MKEVLILKHVPNEDAGTIRDFMESKGISYRAIDLFSGAKLPEDVSNVAAAIIMGGPMNVYEEDKHPFLKDEDRFIKALMKAQIPCFGVCLGSQLIAKAMGKRVMKASVAEIGWQEVALTPQAAQDAVFSQVSAPKLKVLQWHEDTFELPPGAVLLASGQDVPNQAYVIEERIYGLQFHVEVNRPMLEDWFKKREDLNLILKQFDDYRPELKKITDRMYVKFFELIAQPV